MDGGKGYVLVSPYVSVLVWGGNLHGADNGPGEGPPLSPVQPGGARKGYLPLKPSHREGEGSVGWLVEWGFYALLASKAIFRARTYNCNLFSPVMMIT